MTEIFSNQSITQIRREVFSTRLVPDDDLVEMVKGTETHHFLINPSSQLIYQYLTLFVKVFSEQHWERSISDLTILDWGAGKGQTTYFLRKLGANPISCDLLNGQEDSSFHQETPILDRVGIDVDGLEHESQLPYGDCSVDVVISMGVLEHVAHDRASLQEIQRILSPGGLFFCFFLPQSLSWTQRFAHLRGNRYHDRLYTPSQVRDLLRTTGFTLLDLWHRQLLPKNSIRYPRHHLFEHVDQWLTEFTPLQLFATNMEFVACKSDREPHSHSIVPGGLEVTS